MPVGTIKNKFVRRAGLLIVAPLAVIWVFNWRLVAWPFAVFLEAILRAGLAVRETVEDNFASPPVLFLLKAFRAAWNGDFTDTPSINLGDN